MDWLTEKERYKTHWLQRVDLILDLAGSSSCYSAVGQNSILPIFITEV